MSLMSDCVMFWKKCFPTWSVGRSVTSHWLTRLVQFSSKQKLSWFRQKAQYNGLPKKYFTHTDRNNCNHLFCKVSARQWRSLQASKGDHKILLARSSCKGKGTKILLMETFWFQRDGDQPRLTIYMQLNCPYVAQNTKEPNHISLNFISIPTSQAANWAVNNDRQTDEEPLVFASKPKSSSNGGWWFLRLFLLWHDPNRSTNSIVL